MKYNFIKDDFFYHISAIFNDGRTFRLSCTREQMVEFIKENRNVPRSRFKSDDDLIKTYLAVKERVPEEPKPALPKGKFLFLYLRDDLWKAIENNIPKDKWESFVENAIEKILRQEGFYTKRKATF